MLTTSPAALDPALLARFISIVGDRNAVTDPQAQMPYLMEMRDMFAATPRWCCGRAASPRSRQFYGSPARPRPRSCRRAATPACAAARSPQHGEVVLSLNRLDRIREVDPVSNTMTCEAGVTLQRAREAAAGADRLYPQLLPSEGTCTIGGNLSTNAGGTAALAHGIARSHALGHRGGAGRRARARQSQQAQEGQHRLRSQEPVHRRGGHARRDHRGGAAAGAAAALGGDRVRRRAVAAGGARSARARAPSAPPAR